MRLSALRKLSFDVQAYKKCSFDLQKKNSVDKLNFKTKVKGNILK